MSFKNIIDGIRNREPQSIRLRNLDSAAKLIADKLGLTIVTRSSDSGVKIATHIWLQWQLADVNSTKVGYIRLECERGYDPEGKSWSGFVTIELAPDMNSKLNTVASERLVAPWGMTKGVEARQKTKARFCKYAAKFVAPKLENIA